MTFLGLGLYGSQGQLAGFNFFPIVSRWEPMNPGAGPFLTPGSRLAGFIKTTTHCYIQNMKALGLVVSEKKIFFFFFFFVVVFFFFFFVFVFVFLFFLLLFFFWFSHDALGVGPVWTPGTRLAGFIKRTTKHCYTQNRKALCLVVSEKIF